jgi:hypothetical protein
LPSSPLTAEMVKRAFSMTTEEWMGLSVVLIFLVLVWSLVQYGNGSGTG